MATTFSVKDTVLEKIREAAVGSPSIFSRLVEMNGNPVEKAKRTNIPIIAEFYVNAGRYCLLYDISGDASKIYIREIVLSVLLDKILKGKIPIPDRLKEAAA